MKKELRNQIKTQSRSFSLADLDAQSLSIMSRIEALPQFIEARAVAIFWPLPDEVDTRAFIEKWCNEKQILLPVMCPGFGLELRPYQKGCKMNCADYGIYEPSEGEAHPPAQIDLIIVPGVAFDRRGNRLGRGKGFYDRLLKDIKAYKAGVCFSYQMVESVPADSHDIRMDTVISG